MKLFQKLYFTLVLFKLCTFSVYFMSFIGLDVSRAEGGTANNYYWWVPKIAQSHSAVGVIITQGRRGYDND